MRSTTSLRRNDPTRAHLNSAALSPSRNKYTKSEKAKQDRKQHMLVIFIVSFLFVVLIMKYSINIDDQEVVEHEEKLRNHIRADDGNKVKSLEQHGQRKIYDAAETNNNNAASAGTITSDGVNSPSSLATLQQIPLERSPSNIKNTLGAKTLRSYVKTAAHNDELQTLDLPGIVWMEHVTLVIGNRPTAKAFYQDFLGLCRHPKDAFSFHNLGQQGIHIIEKEDEDGPRRLTGSIGLSLPDLDTVRDRIEEASKALKGTSFQILEDNIDEEGTLTVSGPWGNIYHLYCAKRESQKYPAPKEGLEMNVLFAPGGKFSSTLMSVRNQPGIRYIEVASPVGSTSAIQKFYTEMVQTTTTRLAEDVVAIGAGDGIHIVYSESSTISAQDKADMVGVHIGVYVPNFKPLYDRLASRNLVWTNPRFSYIDTCDTWEEAMASRSLRFKEIIDLDTGEKILEFEQEARALRHGKLLHVQYYEPK